MSSVARSGGGITQGMGTALPRGLLRSSSRGVNRSLSACRFSCRLLAGAAQFNPSARQVFGVRPAVKKQFHGVTSAAFPSSA